MKKNLTAQIIFRTAYIAVAFIAFLSSIGFWSIGTGKVNPNVNPFFFMDYFNWALIMSLVVSVVGLIENVNAVKEGKTEMFTKKLPILKFATMSSMIFCFVLGAFTVDRVGYNRLTDSTSYSSIFPGIATAGYWMDMSVFLPRFVCPIAYMVMHFLFEERGKSRKLYSELGIVIPTVFYLFDKFFGMIMISAYGGAEKLVELGLYEIACPYFFYDEAFTFTQWWWILLWPSIFGVILVVINKTTFILSRLVKCEDGKYRPDMKSKPNEDEMNDLVHIIKLRLAEKKAAKVAIVATEISAEAEVKEEKETNSEENKL